MPKIRTFATLGLLLAIPLGALAQDPAGNPAPPIAPGLAAATAEAPLTEAEKIVDRAIAKLREIKSASARIQVAADMLNQKFSLEGDYKKAPGNRVFLLLALVGSADSTDRMLQVSDGITLWDFNKVLEHQECTRRSLDKILKVLNSPDCDPKMRDDVMGGLGFAGPEAVLSGLRKAFVIDQFRDAVVDGRKVWILGGSWKDSKLATMPGVGATPFTGPLPPYIPTLVTITIGQDDGWPYEVVFEGRKPAQIESKRKMEQAELDSTGRAIGKRMTAPAAKPSRVVLVYSNVKINVPIPEETFSFEPPKDARTRDETDLVVSMLEQNIANSAKVKKDQAAKAGPVLEGAVPAPGPGGDGTNRPSDAPK
jgi:hypothetical protein